MKILVVDNNIVAQCVGAQELRREALRAAPGATIYTRRAPEEDLPDPDAYDRIIVSGSKTSVNDSAPWTLKLEAFVLRAMDLGKPYLGICYGHQILAKALAGKASVRRADQPELGWTKIEVVRDSALLRGISAPFQAFSSHFDEVVGPPSGFIHLARSACCGVQAMQLGDKPVFGVQFHPEKNLEETEDSMREFIRKGRKKLVTGLGQGKKRFDPTLAGRIFGNFISL